MSSLSACGRSEQLSKGEDGDTSQPIAQDIAALRTAAGAGSSNEAIRALSSLLATAQSVPNDREGWKGQTLIRAQLPAIVGRFLRDYSSTRHRLRGVRTATPGGAAIKAWLLRGYERQRRQLLALRAEIAGGSYAWGAILHWEGTQNAAAAKSGKQLRSIIRGLPMTQQRQADLALAN